MLFRKMYNELEKWKNKDKNQAFILIGARQTGKTTIVREFANKNYESFVEINFLTDTNANKIFQDSLDVEKIIENISAYTRKPMPNKNTLILLDEIQECPEARTAINFLVEDGRYDYIEIGSMLDVKYKNIRFFPVGLEELHEMYPMDFEEFIIACGVQNNTIESLKKCYECKNAVPDVIHQTMNKLFYLYLVVGGMPNIVNTYVNTHNISSVIDMQTDLIQSYRLDISKYADDFDKIKIQTIYNSIPAQLAEKNRRFMLSHIDKYARLYRYEDSFQWLADAGVALPVYNVSEPQQPLTSNEKRNLFKLYMGDTGLLCASSMDNIQFRLLQGEVDINLGSILENMFAQQLKCNGFDLYYFDSPKKYGEIDFVLSNSGNIDIIEINSGNDYKKHTALDNVIHNAAWKFNNKIVFSKSNLFTEDDIMYLPFYMIMFYTHDISLQDSYYQIDTDILNMF